MYDMTLMCSYKYLLMKDVLINVLCECVLHAWSCVIYVDLFLFLFFIIFIILYYYYYYYYIYIFFFYVVTYLG
jgi:hypothetical protein